MDIIQRNFLRLLRCGAFGKTEPIEPMSHWKWNRLYQISQIHGVTPWIRDGIRRCQDDFFLQMPPSLRQHFEEDQTSTREEQGPEELTNPMLNRKLQQLAEESGSEDPTFNLLLRLIHIARNIMTQGISLRQLAMLGIYLRTTKDAIEYEVLKTWIHRLDMGQMARLEGSMLMELFDFTEKNAADWYFTQGQSIFVRSSDSRAMMWHVKQSARYMRYYPMEAVTNFIRNFTHSMSHIEE